MGHKKSGDLQNSWGIGAFLSCFLQESRFSMTYGCSSSLFMVFPCFLFLLFSTTACNPIHDFYSCFPPRGNGTLGLCICWFLANTLNHTTPGTPQDMMSWAELHRSPQGALSKLCLLRTGLKHRMTAGFLHNTSVFLMP